MMDLTRNRIEESIFCIDPLALMQSLIFNRSEEARLCYYPQHFTEASFRQENREAENYIRAYLNLLVRQPLTARGSVVCR
jgi:hypothetical protein